MEDAEIVERYWARDETALRETSEKYGRYCYAIAYGILRSAEDAEESTNDTYLAAWEAMPPHRPEALSAFLGKLTRNISLKRLRARGTQKRGGGQAALALHELEECIPDGKSVDEALSAEELAGVIDGFLRALPEDERRVFIRRYWHLLPVKEICRQFAFSRSKVDSMLHRTRKKLRERLEQEGYYV